VLGAQQNRTFDVSALVAAGERLMLPVSCVEAGRWDGRRFGERMRISPHAADPSLRRVKRRAANLRAGEGLEARADQGEVWSQVGSRLADHAIDSASAALSDVYDGMRHDLDELARVVRPVEEQVGAVACVGARPVALDLVSRPDVFADLLPRLAQGYALDALGATDRAPQPERAEAFLREALDAPRTRLETPGLGHGLAIGAPRITGSGLEHDGELVQPCAFPSDGEPRSGRPIVPPSERRRL
jgi:ARG/rhodanese/phosphatase superfamily protein